jgi:hypothetical protein
MTVKETRPANDGVNIESVKIKKTEEWVSG